jgi:hypothetical protein
VARAQHFADSQGGKVKEGSRENSRYTEIRRALELGPGS